MSKPLPTIVVQGAIDILSDPKRWCRGEFAVNRWRQATSPWAEDATKFCAIGALRKAAYDLTQNEREARQLAHDIQYKIEDRIQGPFRALWRVNDEDRHGRTAVLGLMKDYLASKKE